MLIGSTPKPLPAETPPGVIVLTVTPAARATWSSSSSTSGMSVVAGIAFASW